MGCVSLYIKRDTYTPTTPHMTRSYPYTYTHEGTRTLTYIWDAYTKKGIPKFVYVKSFSYLYSIFDPSP